MQHAEMHGGLKGCQCPTSNSLSWMLPPFSIPWDTASLGTHPVLAGGSNGAGDCHLPLPSIRGLSLRPQLSGHPSGVPALGAAWPGVPGSLCPARGCGWGDCAGAWLSTIWFPTNNRPTLAPGRGVAAAVAAVYSVPRLWHVPAKSPLLSPLATGFWGCIAAVQSPAPHPGSCPASACPGVAAARRGRCPGLPVPEESPLRPGSCLRRFSHPLCSTGWDPQYQDRVDSPAMPSPLWVLGGCSALLSLAPTTSLRLTLTTLCRGDKGGQCLWVAPVQGQSPRLPPLTPGSCSHRCHRHCTEWGLCGAICL